MFVYIYIHIYTNKSIRSIKINENSTLFQRGKNDRRVIIVRSCLLENFIKQQLHTERERVYEMLKFYQKSN